MQRFIRRHTNQNIAVLKKQILELNNKIDNINMSNSQSFWLNPKLSIAITFILAIAGIGLAIYLAIDAEKSLDTAKNSLNTAINNSITSINSSITRTVANSLSNSVQAINKAVKEASDRSTKVIDRSVKDASDKIVNNVNDVLYPNDFKIRIYGHSDDDYKTPSKECKIDNGRFTPSPTNINLNDNKIPIHLCIRNFNKRPACNIPIQIYYSGDEIKETFNEFKSKIYAVSSGSNLSYYEGGPLFPNLNNYKKYNKSICFVYDVILARSNQCFPEIDLTLKNNIADIVVCVNGDNFIAYQFMLKSLN